MFCVECGSEEEIFGSLCRKCLLSKDLIMPPSYIALDMCHGCGRFFEAGRWKDMYHLELASEILESQTKTHAQVESLRFEIPDFPPDKGEHRETCRAIAMIGNREFEQDFEIGIRIKVQMCPSCSRQGSDYFEAIIQLRRDDVAVKDAEIELAIENQQILKYSETLAGNEENAFLSKWGAVPGGMDYYIGSIVLAKNIAAKMRDNYGASLKESNTVIGMRDGQDLYRWTILVRMPANGVGDVVAYDRKLYVVDGVTRKIITLKGIRHGHIYRIPPEDVKLKPVCKYSQLLEAVVVSHEGKTIQVLDPDNYKTVTLALPPYLKHIGETVPVVRYDEQLHVV